MPSSTAATVQKLQAEYNRLQKVGVEQFGPKAMQQLEKQLREQVRAEMKKKLGDVEDFKRQKGEVFQALHAAKVKLRGELVAAAVGGEISAEEAEKQIVALGWELAVARAEIRKASKAPVGDQIETAVELPPSKDTREELPAGVAIETLATTPDAPPAAAATGEHEEILDPVGAAKSVTEEVKYAEPGQPGNRNKAGRRR